MKSAKLTASVILLACFLTGLPGKAWSEVGSRPKIGLVLAGGGARGSAHIGVLKVLEENRIPIDYISGTSMGAIVGGGYAAGLSPQEIEKTIGGINWNDVMDDYPQRQDLPIRDKLDRRRYLPLEFGLKKGSMTLPAGAIAGQKLEFILHGMTLHTAGLKSFDELPVPFRAVATDIETGEEVDLADGRLADALRASMAVPGAFSPLELNGRLLVDGYVVKNLPVDVAQKMGAEVLIVVNVGGALQKREELNSLTKVMAQGNDILMRKNVNEQLAKMGPNDVLITPELGTMTTASFDRCAEGIAAGDKAARAMVDKLKRFSVSEAEYAGYLKRQRRVALQSLPIDFIEVEEPKRVSKEAVLAKIHTKTGQPVDLAQLQRDLTSIESLGDFSKVGFRVVDKGGKHGIVFETTEKEWGPNYVRFGTNLGTNFRGDSIYNIMADYTMTDINKLGAEWKNEGQLGQTDRVYTEFYQPLESSRTLFIAPSAEWRQDSRYIYSDGQRVAEYLTRRLYGGGDIGVNIGTAAQVRAGTYWGTLDAQPSTGSAGLDELDVNRAGVRIQATYDKLDDVFFPKNGLYARSTAWLELEDLGGEQSYEKYETTAMAVKTFGKHTVLLGGALGVSPNDNVPFYDQFTLGGFLNLSGFHNQELRGKQSASLKGVYYYQLMEKFGKLLQGVYVGGSVEGGNVWNDFDDMDVSDFSMGGSAFLGVRTMLGPVYLAYGQNEDAGTGQVTLYVGQIF